MDAPGMQCFLQLCNKTGRCSHISGALDYIDALTATDTSTAPDVIWPELPEA